MQPRKAICPAATDKCKDQGCEHSEEHYHGPMCDEICETGKSYCLVSD